MREDTIMLARSRQTSRLTRRDLLRAGLGAAAAPVAAAVAGTGWPDARTARALVLLHLGGGNDGLNTVIPYADPLYYRLRPRLSAAARHVLPLDAGIGLHPSLAALNALFKKGRLAIVQGVGYPDPDYSHIGSSRIWVTGRHDERHVATWWDQALNGSSGAPVETACIAPHSLPMISNARACAARGDGKTGEGEGNIARALTAAVRYIVSASGPCLLFASVQGFDSHEDQLSRHACILRELDDGLAAFHRRLESLGLADRVVLMAWSEFGRRPAENAAGGTDHGAAGPVFLTGASIRGGLYGRTPSLEETDFGNLVPTVDFRAVYATLAKRWLGCARGVPWPQPEPLDFLDPRDSAATL